MKPQARPRRRRNTTIAERLRAAPRGVALAVPATLVALFAAGLVASATPAAPQPAAAPAVRVTTAPHPATAVRDDTLERTTRLLAGGRPALTGTSNVGLDAQRQQALAKQADQRKAAAKAARSKAQKKAAAKARASAKAKAKARAKAEAKAKARARARAQFTPSAAQLKVTKHRYTTVSLNVRTQPRDSASLVTVLDPRSRVSVTDTTKGSWTLVIHHGQGRWVHGKYLVKKKPEKKSAKKSTSTSGGASHRSCSSGSGMEHGLTSDAILVHRSVCARWPQIKSYGGLRSGGDSFHNTGQAVDIMIPSSSVGQQVADWVRANHKRLGVSQVIWSQHIWTVQRSGEGWRGMSDRGNRTANHYDHVHVSVYGNQATG